VGLFQRKNSSGTRTGLDGSRRAGRLVGLEGKDQGRGGRKAGTRSHRICKDYVHFNCKGNKNPLEDSGRVCYDLIYSLTGNSG
jgi:hypothetical protein